MSAIAVVIARGGSQRIPRKNFRDFAKRPMIEWPIEAALTSGFFSRVLVSTDDSDIARIATNAGAEVPFDRPADLADDRAGTLEVVSHAVNWALGAGWRFRSACCLYGTAAFTSADDLGAARDRHAEGGWDYVFAAGRFQRPAQRAFVKADDGSMTLLIPGSALTRTQDLDPTYYDAGQFYWGSTDAWAEPRPIYGSRTTFVELPVERALDIDTPEDWSFAEQRFKEWKQRCEQR